MSIRTALPRRLRDLCQERRWSQRELAERLGVTQSYVCRLLDGSRRANTLDCYERLARIFGVSLSALISDLERAMSERFPDEVLQRAIHAANAA